MHPPTNRPPSHYAHLSDALHHAYHFKHEWIMVVEDDFAVCGAWGMEGIVRVLLELGSSLIDSADADVLHRSGIVDDSWKAGEKRHAQWRGAFVGTGGSGLILHHTLLPTVIRLLELVAGLSESGTPLPRTPPDVLVQQCLSGEIALCTAVANPTISPKYSHSQKEEFERSPYPTLLPIAPTLGLPPLVTPFAPPAFLISSRLLMSHTGHALSTGNRFYLEGQWACGWRQPMLGNRGVSVVVV
ncbi:uncharacterized protein PHACADRAFT_202040 [Phanerochaete carnosa HHB-10118-sp]|uniref:Glycosyltransferase family 25 protein n=1 Tax=Phanerochaete carnosa (strain HHB-10118-sp) TaxID=650164 RepID=K5WFV1_PHACS|nr:uncharacterized protein PHACADRAFT_202040 [Phanerochaete carnosa HHB-10118-sp]EKM49077.1 hypothetical protein PHACADRAFT_202040 [Phanerochaete carnosa HHB-10118-sp]